ncbi:MAG: hypothetical protein B7Y39_12285 [Bdellovibrio sp. 28-41-41]|nr:MAG: hypothetical protein B7Y39_12285 [Bdellovibrio sp. 28-41-41]
MIQTLFPTQILTAQLSPAKSSLLKDLKKDTLKISEIDHDGQEWSEKNYLFGYTSYGSMDQLHLFSSTFEELKKKLDKHVATYVKELGWDISPSDLHLSKMWANVMPRGTIHTGHIHPLSVISGTVYISLPKKNVPALKFEDPRFTQMMATPPKKKNVPTKNLNFFNFIPKEGEVVLFESWLRHEVVQNNTDDLRISISFNYDWT